MGVGIFLASCIWGLARMLLLREKKKMIEPSISSLQSCLFTRNVHKVLFPRTQQEQTGSSFLVQKSKPMPQRALFLLLLGAMLTAESLVFSWLSSLCVFLVSRALAHTHTDTLAIKTMLQPLHLPSVFRKTPQPTWPSLACRRVPWVADSIVSR